MALLWHDDDDARVAQVEADLGTVRIGREGLLGDTLRSLAEVLGASTVMMTAFAQTASGVVVERWRGALVPAGLRARVEAWLSAITSGSEPFDASGLPPGFRDRAVDLHTVLEATPPRGGEGLALLQLAQLHVAGAFVYGSGRLLGWFGAVLRGAAGERELAILDRLIPVMRWRFDLERDLAASARHRAALAASLDHLGVAAFVVGPEHELFETNAPGRALVTARRAEVLGGIASAIAGRGATLRFEVRALADDNGWLAVLGNDAAGERIDVAVAAATARWGLTPRQRDVLELVVRGHANATIAACLEIAERTVELHVTALLDRFGVDNRASLVARVLL